MVVVRKRDGLAMKPPTLGGGGPIKRHVASHGLSGVSMGTLDIYFDHV